MWNQREFKRYSKILTKCGRENTIVWNFLFNQSGIFHSLGKIRYLVVKGSQSVVSEFHICIFLCIAHSFYWILCRISYTTIKWWYTCVVNESIHIIHGYIPMSRMNALTSWTLSLHRIVNNCNNIMSIYTASWSNVLISRMDVLEYHEW